MIDYANISSQMGAILDKGMATLKEVQEWYSMDDVLTMYEVITVNNYNSRVLAEE